MTKRCVKHQWSNPVDELGGNRACRKCGHIADRDERRSIFFEARAEQRRLAKGRHG